MQFHGIPKWDHQRFPEFDLVAYHDNCTDGIMAAAAVAYLLSLRSSPEFVPVQYKQDLPEAIRKGGKRILFVDFCPEQDQLARVAEAWEDYFVIDHHKSRDWTAQAPWNEHVFYSPEHSGAYLAWAWFVDHSDPPSMIRYVEDRDLWTWRLPFSREVSAALGEEPKTVQRFQELLFTDPPELFKKGQILLWSRTRHARNLAEKAFLLVLNARVAKELEKSAVINAGEVADVMTVSRAVNATENLSEVGEETLRAFPSIEVALAFFQPSPEAMQLSFRSRAHQPGKWTALRAAKLFGGGGHEHAAGARVTLEEWNQILREGA